MRDSATRAVVSCADDRPQWLDDQSSSLYAELDRRGAIDSQRARDLSVVVNATLLPIRVTRFRFGRGADRLCVEALRPLVRAQPCTRSIETLRSRHAVHDER